MRIVPLSTLMLVLASAPVMAADLNDVEAMDRNYPQLVADGWEEIGVIAPGYILMGKENERALCELNDIRRVLENSRDAERDPPEYSFACFMIETVE